MPTSNDKSPPEDAPPTYPNPLDRFGFDAYFASVVRTSSPFSFGLDAQFYMSLTDSLAGLALSSDSLASVPFTLASWPQAAVGFRAGPNAGVLDFSATGTIQSLVAVPEPATLFPLLLCAVGLGIRRSFASPR